MSIDNVNPTQKFYYLQTGVILQKCVILPLKRFELPNYKVMLHLRGVKLQLGLTRLHRNLTHSVYSVIFFSFFFSHCKNASMLIRKNPLL